FRRPRGSLALSGALHPSGCHLQPPPRLTRQKWRHLQVEGLSPRRPRAIHTNDARHKRVHPPLPDACLAAALPPHPLLWLPHLSNPAAPLIPVDAIRPSTPSPTSRKH